VESGAVPPPQAPADGPPPRLVKIQALCGKLVLREPKTSFGFAPIAEPKAGAATEQPKPKAMTHWDSRVIDASAFRLYEVDGRPVDPATFAKSAGRPIVALLSDHDKKVDPAWLSIYNSGALVVYVRPQAMQFGHGYGGGTYAPPPPADSPPRAPAAGAYSPAPTDMEGSY
jgi:hypothetical protein